MSKKIVVALGGNAILTDDASATAQQKALLETAQYLAEFIIQGNQLIVSHGNGPQVGNLLLQMAGGSTDKNPAMPLDTDVAMTQGSIGYWLQNALGRVLREKGIDRDVATVVTQVLVDANDQAFINPSKPVGPFYDEAGMKKAKAANSDFTFVEDAGRGYRRVVSSPRPVGVQEYRTINTMVANDIVPISVGGGGVPVVKEGNQLVGREAVIDKDFASEKLAELVHADQLIILTAVDNIYVNFNKPDQKKLEHVTVAELKRYMDENQFAKGSMLPKVQAAIEFVEKSGGTAVVTSLQNVANYLNDGSGTIITK